MAESEKPGYFRFEIDTGQNKSFCAIKALHFLLLLKLSALFCAQYYEGIGTDKKERLQWYP